VDLAQLDQRANTLDSITTLATADVAGYFATIQNEAAPRIAAQLRDAVPAVVNAYGEIAGIAAADWYESVRPVSGFNAVTVTPPKMKT